MSAATRVLFASDIHASDRCFRKFVGAARAKNGPDVLIIGGDITGKYLVPVVRDSRGQAAARFEGQEFALESEAEIVDFERALRDKGAYTWRCTSTEFERFQTEPEFRKEVDRDLRSRRLRDWMDLADEWLKGSGRRVFMSGGNDDPWYVDDILRESQTIMCPDGLIVPISESLIMLSSGVANMTPWKCPRDLPEEEVADRIETMAREVSDFSQCVFNLHCPPFGTLLDQAPKLDKDLRVVASAFGVEEMSVGSRAVRQAIEHYQPVVSLHGHVHESRAFQRIGKTVAFNPGSEYAIGRLNVAILDFDGNRLEHFDLVTDRD